MNKAKQYSEFNKKNYLQLLEISNNNTFAIPDELDEEYSSLFNQGLEFMTKGLLEEAIEYFDQAIRMNPFNLRAYHQKGKCLVLLNKDEEGFQCFEKAFNVKNLGTTLQQVRSEPENRIKSEQIEIEGPKQPLTDKELENILSERLSANFDSDFMNSFESKNERMGSKLKRLLNPETAIEDEHTAYSRYNNYKNQLEEEIQIDMKNYKDVSNKTQIQTDLEPFNLSLNRYKQPLPDMDIFPREGGKQLPKDNFIEQLLEFQRSEIEYALNYLRDQQGGFFYYSVEPKYLLTISMALLKMAIVDFKMDGIVVTADKRANQIHRIVNTWHSPKCQPYYIDCNFGSYGQGNMESTCEVDRSLSNGDEVYYRTTFLNDTFSFKELKDAIEISIQKVAEEYEGEDHFIFFDNIAAFQNFTSDREIKKFFSQFGKKIRELDLYGFFMLPKNTINVTFNDSLRNFPKALSERLRAWSK